MQAVQVYRILSILFFIGLVTTLNASVCIVLMCKMEVAYNGSQTAQNMKE